MTKTTKERRKHLFKHRSYLDATADRIAVTLPTKDIIYNTLLAVYEVAFSEGYMTRIDDAAWFKMKQEEHRKNSFNRVKDHIDDIIFDRTKPQSNNKKKKKK